MTRKQEIEAATADEHDVLGDWTAEYDLNCFECGEHYQRCECYGNKDWMIVDGLCVAIINEFDAPGWLDTFTMSFGLGSEEA